MKISTFYIRCDALLAEFDGADPFIAFLAHQAVGVGAVWGVLTHTRHDDDGIGTLRVIDLYQEINHDVKSTQIQ